GGAGKAGDGAGGRRARQAKGVLAQGGRDRVGAGVRAGRRAVAKLAVAVVPPALDGAARKQRTGREAAHGDRRGAAQAGDRYGVVAPALDGAPDRSAQAEKAPAAMAGGP